jgi:ATP-dependent protease ClpP protease subunit
MDTITADTDRDFFMSAQEAVRGRHALSCGGC